MKTRCYRIANGGSGHRRVPGRRLRRPMLLRCKDWPRPPPIHLIYLKLRSFRHFSTSAASLLHFLSFKGYQEGGCWYSGSVFQCISSNFKKLWFSVSGLTRFMCRDYGTSDSPPDGTCHCIPPTPHQKKCYIFGRLAVTLNHSYFPPSATRTIGLYFPLMKQNTVSMSL